MSARRAQARFCAADRPRSHGANLLPPQAHQMMGTNYALRLSFPTPLSSLLNLRLSTARKHGYDYIETCAARTRPSSARVGVFIWWAGSSVGQSTGLLIRVSWVRIPAGSLSFSASTASQDWRETRRHNAADCRSSRHSRPPAPACRAFAGVRRRPDSASGPATGGGRLRAESAPRQPRDRRAVSERRRRSRLYRKSANARRVRRLEHRPRRTPRRRTVRLRRHTGR